MAVTTIRGGRQISDGTIPYVDIQTVGTNAVLGNPTASTATVSEISLATSSLLGRAATGNITAITLGSGLAFSGTSIIASSVPWSSITSTPTTLSGYGITDALSASTTSVQDGYFGNVNLFDDTTPSHYLSITNFDNLTAARILRITVNDADRTISLSGSLTVSATANISGTNTGDQTITLTGDVTGFGTGSFAATISSGAVTLAKMANLAANSIIGNNTGVAATPSALTGTQVTALLDDAGASTRGVVTTGTQTIAGDKTLSGSTSIGLNYFANASSNGSGFTFTSFSSVTHKNSFISVAFSTTLANSSVSALALNNFVTNATITAPSAGTHGLVANVAIKGVSIVTSTGTVTNSASLYISEASSNATNNYSIWVDAGTVRFDDNIELQGIPTKSTETNVLYYDPGTKRVSYGTISSASGVTSITGTANQVLANATSGSAQTGAVTLTLPQNIHTGATPTFAGLTITAGTVTTSTPYVNKTQTWNAGAVVFTGELINITETASAATSKFIEYQLTGATKFAIQKDGTITTGIWGGTTIATNKGGTGLTSFTSGGAVYANSTSTLTTGTLPLTAGGTNNTSVTQYGVAFGGPGATAIAYTAAGSTGNYLRAITGAGPSWSTLVLPDTATSGQLVYASATNTYGGLTTGSAGQILRVNSGATGPEWFSLTPVSTYATVTGPTGTGVNDLYSSSIAANTLFVGRKIRWSIYGTYNNTTTAAQPIIFTFKAVTSTPTTTTYPLAATNTPTATNAYNNALVIPASQGTTAPVYRAWNAEIEATCTAITGTASTTWNVFMKLYFSTYTGTGTGAKTAIEFAIAQGIGVGGPPANNSFDLRLGISWYLGTTGKSLFGNSLVITNLN